VKIEPGCLRAEEEMECWSVGALKSGEEGLRQGHQHNKPATATATATTPTCFRFGFFGCGLAAGMIRQTFSSVVMESSVRMQRVKRGEFPAERIRGRPSARPLA